jgi:hypothetical protein
MSNIIKNTSLELYREIGMDYLDTDKTDDEVLKEFQRLYQSVPKKGWHQYDILATCVGIYIQGRK